MPSITALLCATAATGALGSTSVAGASAGNLEPVAHAESADAGDLTTGSDSAVTARVTIRRITPLIAPA